MEPLSLVQDQKKGDENELTPTPKKGQPASQSISQPRQASRQAGRQVGRQTGRRFVRLTNIILAPKNFGRFMCSHDIVERMEGFFFCSNIWGMASRCRY